MKEQIRDKWADALESGRFAQTTGTLRDDNGHCCLGVLCDVAIESGLKELMWEESRNAYLYRCSLEDHEFCGRPIEMNGATWHEAADGVLPDAVCGWAGLDSNPVLDPTREDDDDDDVGTAIWFNDDNHSGFREIAQLVRALPVDPS